MKTVYASDPFNYFYSNSGFDWVDPDGELRDPITFRYSYSPYYLWRDFNKYHKPENIQVVHYDRMRQWDPEAFAKAFKGIGGLRMENLTKKEAQKIIRIYFNGKYECVGFAVGANMSNGYPIGMFFMKEK